MPILVELVHSTLQLQSPRFSPFAIAVSSAKMVLAVPNRLCSIYTRSGESLPVASRPVVWHPNQTAAQTVMRQD